MTYKKKPFSQHEDELLMMHAKKTSWVALTHMFVGRSDDSLRNRYNRLNTEAKKIHVVKQKSLSKSRIFFSKEEDDYIQSFVNSYGKKWIELSTAFSTRFRSTTSTNTRNRWARLNRREKSHENLSASYSSNHMTNDQAHNDEGLSDHEDIEINIDEWLGLI